MKNYAQQPTAWTQVIPSSRYRRSVACKSNGFPTT